MLATGVTARIGGISAQVTYAGITESGVTQINVTVPVTIPDEEPPSSMRSSAAGLSDAIEPLSSSSPPQIHLRQP